MANLTTIPGGGPREYKGTIVKNSAGALTVNVMGNTLPCRFADPLVLADGDPVLVTITGGPRGGFEAIVRCRLTEQPRPSNGTVATVPASSSTITVTGSDGVAYTANFASSYTPTVGDTVILAWSAGTPTALAKVGATPAPDAPPPPPPPPAPVVTVRTGSTAYRATDSATWSPQLGGWDEWNGGGGNTYQGTWAGYTLYGSWFYNGGPTQLAGRTITGIVFRIGARRQVGNYNQPVTVQLYAHTSRSRPGGDVTRTVGPLAVTIQPQSGAYNIAVPLTFAQTLLNGGGISIAGPDYAGFLGRYAQPDSGLLTFNWSR